MKSLFVFEKKIILCQPWMKIFFHEYLNITTHCWNLGGVKH